ncbi:nucleotidyltransferase domain-containing protein [Halovivax gelatinilyticus]|uniref:nucleotidyltransferase domain-containing protein n=1 Tax=Halovivax gelatinilyticus TaxID=2961597 RepID=UPI0020CA8853|nr:nucleotidyltransferase domain-containing protein [Halovivax gelatinilyticus]
MQDLLSVLIDQPYDEFTGSELAALIDADRSTVSKAVSLLTSVDAVETRRDGRKRFVRVNRDRLSKPDPILSIAQTEFHQPVHAFVERARENLDTLAGIVLFGSVARGNADRASDIDLLVLVAEDKTAARRTVQSIVRELEETTFDGDRYTYQPLVESTESARRIGDRLREQFNEGITLVPSDQLTDVRREVYADGE